MRRGLLFLGILCGISTALAAEPMAISSPAFREGEEISIPYSRNGGNVSPPLEIAGVPAKAESLSIAMIDPDAPSGDWVHWLVADLPPDTTKLIAGELPRGVVHGRNGWGSNRYDGPQPPKGTHHYVITLYALDRHPGLPEGFTREQMDAAMNGHVLAKAELTGTFSKSKSDDER